MTYTSTVLGDGAVGYWQLGEPSGTAAVDSTGNQNGVYTQSAGGGFTLGQPGIAGVPGSTAVLLASSQAGRITIADIAAQHVGDTLTMEAWVKRVVGFTSSIQSILSGQAGGPYYRINAANQIDILRSNISDMGHSSATVGADGFFHHIVWTKATTVNHIYLDGIDVTGSISNTAMANSTSYVIGADTPGGDPANMTVCHVALYPVALTPTQVSTHFTLGSTIPTVQVQLPQGPIARGSFG